LHLETKDSYRNIPARRTTYEVQHIDRVNNFTYHCFMAKSDSVGEVTHWYDKIGVAVIKLKKGLKIGDSIKVKHGDDEFGDSINSMQLNHEPVESGKKGDEVAIKLSQKAREGSEIHLA